MVLPQPTKHFQFVNFGAFLFIIDDLLADQNTSKGHVLSVCHARTASFNA